VTLINHQPEPTIRRRATIRAAILVILLLPYELEPNLHTGGG